MCWRRRWPSAQEDQKKAIEARHRNILVAAAAGSGKTRVLVDRIIAQLLARECSVDEMLVVTFTNAAATEMRERIDKALQQKLLETDDRATAEWLERQIVLLSGASICTFHAFCQKVIRQNIDAIDVDPQFRLASDQEMVLMRRDVLEELLETSYKMPEDEAGKARWQDFLEFVDDYGDDHGDEAVYNAVLKLYSFCQSQPFPKAWLRQQKERYEAESADFWQTPWTDTIVSAVGREIERSVRAYEEVCALVRTGGRSEEAEAALLAAWQPYAEYLQGCIEKLEEVQSAYRAALAEKKAGGWDNFCAAARQWKQPVLRGKKYDALRTAFPEVRKSFEKNRDEAKKIFTDARDRYMAQTEEDVLGDIRACSATVRRYADLTAAFIDALQAAKKERNVLDFNDLEHFALDVLCRDPAALAGVEEADFRGEKGRTLRTDAAEDLREKYAVIMVDEYQDTNGVQEAILNLIARDDNRFTVGDVKQSIYRFRLADPYLFQAKYDAYPEKPGPDDMEQLITMKQNFRSRAEVLAPINFIFDQVMTREAMEIEYDEKSRLYPGASYPEAEHTLKGPMEIDIILRGEPEQPVAGLSQTADDDASDGSGLEGFELEAQHIADRDLDRALGGRQAFVEPGRRREGIGHRRGADHLVVLQQLQDHILAVAVRLTDVRLDVRSGHLVQRDLHGTGLRRGPGHRRRRGITRIVGDQAVDGAAVGRKALVLIVHTDAVVLVVVRLRVHIGTEIGNRLPFAGHLTLRRPDRALRVGLELVDPVPGVLLHDRVVGGEGGAVGVEAQHVAGLYCRGVLQLGAVAVHGLEGRIRLGGHQGQQIGDGGRGLRGERHIDDVRAVRGAGLQLGGAERRRSGHGERGRRLDGLVGVGEGDRHRWRRSRTRRPGHPCRARTWCRRGWTPRRCPP